MARQRATQEAAPVAEKIVDIDVSNEMETSFLEYAYSVIYARALPDARDGLKPVQRRILFQMDRMGLRPDRAHVKCARVVGDVMGKLHPHGDTAIYDTMVRLAQPFTMRLPLVDGHGNFGSLDDGPAAYRYTEARLAPAALAMTKDMDEDTVDFVPNFDSQLTQPSVLPAAFPNLLVNGASGIAVGMATNMPPHNLVEVVGAARYLLEHPDASLDDLMRYVPGPDLPGGGKIVGLDGIREAYETGRGSFKTRATAHIENVTARRKGIVVTELPYLVGPEKVIDKIKDQVKAHRLVGVSAVSDLTDRNNGLKLVIEVKHGFNPEAVLEQLYRLTPMEDSFGINNVALVHGKPQTLGLKALLSVYLEHRVEVVRRRCEFRLGKRRERAHLVDGLLIAIVDIDEVIEVIRTSDDAASAKSRLMGVFDLSEAQADYILELRLRRLTKFSQLELEQEREELAAEIARLEELLADAAKLRAEVSTELDQVAKEYGTPRRTVLLESSGAGVQAADPHGAAGQAVPLEIEDTPCWVLLSGTGLAARTSGPERVEPAMTPEGGPARARHDVVAAQVAGTARGDVGFVTSRGRLLRVSCLDLPVLPAAAGPVSLAGGSPVRELLGSGGDGQGGLARGERVVGLCSLAEGAPPLAVGTLGGVVKRVVPDNPRGDEWDVIALKPGDEVVGAAPADDAATLAFVTSDAQLLRFAANLVRPQGRAAGGMAGVRLAAGAEVVAFGVVERPEDAQLVTVAGSAGALPGTEAGAAKVTPLANYPAKGRATG
ncbi:MAG: DNA topoisomerase IV subunit A, partial [Bifidobacteriaceae bacterium]|nr:DNA topoisomerase IV subunit A [Bifidobacteriaceae bacterium]